MIINLIALLFSDHSDDEDPERDTSAFFSGIS